MTDAATPEKDRLAKAIYLKLLPEASYVPRTRCGLYITVGLSVVGIASLLVAAAIALYTIAGSPVDLSLTSMVYSVAQFGLSAAYAFAVVTFIVSSCFTCLCVAAAYSAALCTWVFDRFCEPLEIAGRSPAPRAPALALLRAEFDPLRRFLQYAMPLGAAIIFFSMQYALSITESPLHVTFIVGFFPAFTGTCVLAFLLSFVLKAKPGDIEKAEAYQREVRSAQRAIA